ncbi:hypothetical protein JL720_7220 [Aureococcus anophagefferens]|nr:hypothetical protein JL720_7220 [Aureococcus anophagefferens]
MRGDALGRKRLLPKSDDKKLALRPLVNRSSLAQARWTKLRRCSRGGLCCLCSCLFLLVFFDLGVVLNNLLIDLDNLWAQASKRRESFLLWDYFDLKAHEELGRKAPGTWSDLIIGAHGALGEAAQAVLTVDAEGELVLGKPQYKNTAEFVVLRDGWAAYKWPYLARRRFFGGATNPRSHVRAHRKARESWFR